MGYPIEGGTEVESIREHLLRLGESNPDRLPARSAACHSGHTRARIGWCVITRSDGQIVDLKRSLPAGKTVNLKLLTDRDPAALGVMRHSAAHVMARAVMRLFSNVGLAFGPTLPNGFYYDFDMPDRIREEDFPRI